MRKLCEKQSRENGTIKKIWKQKPMLWLWKVTEKYKGFVLFFIGIRVYFGIYSVVFAMLFRNLIDYAVAGQLKSFTKTAGILIVLEIIQIGVEALNYHVYEWTRSGLENRLKERFFSFLLCKDYASVTAVHTGEWITRLTSDTGIVTNGVLGIFPGLAGMLARILGALIALFYMLPEFVYLFIPVGLLILFLTSLLRNVLKRLHKKIQEANGIVVSFFKERLDSMMIIRVFSMENQTCKEAVEKMKYHKAVRLKRNHFSNVCSTGFNMIMSGGYLFGAVYCGYGILEKTVSYGTFTAVLQLVGQVQSRFAGISGIIPQYYAMLASAERLMEIERYADNLDERFVSSKEIVRFYQEEFQSIGFKDCSFAYPFREGEEGDFNVFEHFNLDVKKGEYVAFTGHSGCGKSTMLKLLMCLYPLNCGERYIRIKDKNDQIVEIPLTTAWRGLFAYVPQGNQLMSGTIREIITFGVPEDMKDEERIEHALEISCAYEFVSVLEKGVDTVLGEHGNGLSEGQMQRIAIARAVFSDRPILILDESTSSLDELTEQRLLNNLRNMTDKTVLIITHRSTVLRICDKEIVMEKKMDEK